MEILKMTNEDICGASKDNYAKYSAKIASYWIKAVENRSILSSEEVEELKVFKQDLLGSNGTAGSSLVDKIKDILYFNRVMLANQSERELYREYEELDERYGRMCRNGVASVEKEKLLKRLRELQPIFADGHL
ncbi:MAG: hypothetical protein KAT43_05070 [Nanoarchaeota archaeon]|nr:hypothetical protein [Nanoarchaeota archaeon]